MTELASHLGVFLREHLPRDRNASHHTVQSYADSFQLLVCFAAERLGVRPCRIEIEQLTAPLILDFLDNLERERKNTVGTRNVRLAAFKSFRQKSLPLSRVSRTGLSRPRAPSARDSDEAPR